MLVLACVLSRVRVCACSCVCAFVCACVLALVRVCVRVCVRTCVRVCLRACVRESKGRSNMADRLHRHISVTGAALSVFRHLWALSRSRAD